VRVDTAVTLSDGSSIELTVENGSIEMELRQTDAQGNVWPAQSVTMSQTEVDSLIKVLQQAKEPTLQGNS
jgi:hypothetical protein